MVSKNYIPDQGDVCFANMDPIIGHEQAGVRPVLVISTSYFSKVTGLTIICPITSNNKHFPLHYKIISNNKIHGSIMAEHIRSVDYKMRNFNFVTKLDKVEFLEFLGMIFSEVDLKWDIS